MNEKSIISKTEGRMKWLRMDVNTLTDKTGVEKGKTGIKNEANMIIKERKKMTRMIKKTNWQKYISLLR